MIGYILTEKIPGLSTTDPTSLVDYFQAIFTFAIAAAGILALLMIMFGGFQYMTAGGNESRTGDAKNRIKNAILGLILALTSYLILSTINPDLVAIKLTGLEKINPGGFDWEDYLKDFPKAGKKGHNLPDGSVCENHADCYYSRICASSFFCPKDSLKKRYPTTFADPLDLSAPCYDDTDLCDRDDESGEPECIQEKICEPIFNSDGNIVNLKTGAVTSIKAYGFECQNDDDCFDHRAWSGPDWGNLEIPANENIVCNHGKGAICAKQNTYWEPCYDDHNNEDKDKNTECKGDLICDTSLGSNDQGFGLCNTADGTPPPPEDPENGEKAPVPGDQDVFFSISQYKPFAQAPRLLAIMAYEHEWSGIQKCQKSWKKASGYQEEICQMRWPKQPEGLETNDLKIDCDGEKKCTAYQWIKLGPTEGTQAKECDSGWKKHNDADKCIAAGFDEAGSIGGLRDCCTYDIVCCERKPSEISCKNLKAQGGNWKDNNNQHCMEGLDKKIFPDAWITKTTKFLKKLGNVAGKELPGKCCAREVKEGEKPKEEEEWEPIK